MREGSQLWEEGSPNLLGTSVRGTYRGCGRSGAGANAWQRSAVMRRRSVGAEVTACGECGEITWDGTAEEPLGGWARRSVGLLVVEYAFERQFEDLGNTE